MFPQKKSQVQMLSLENSKEEVESILHKLFQKIGDDTIQLILWD